ncbi:MAG: hemolysin family protein [Pseudomonadota bacterium]
MTLLIIYVALALGVSFLCSIMEAVLLSITQPFVATKVEEGHRTAKLLKSYKDDIDRPLAAILTLNTIAHTVGATGAGAQAVKVFGDAWIGMISAVLTFLILFFSEIIPKTLGAVYWRQLASPVAILLKFTIIAMYPVVIVARGLTRLMSHGSDETTISRRELLALAELGATQGVVAEHESRLFRNLLKFRNISVAEIMTPRVVIATLDRAMTVGDATSAEALRFSRVPVHAAGDRDDITGYVLKDEVLERAARDEYEVTLDEVSRKLLVVPPTARLPALFRHLLANGEHIALVADEYGDVAGLVTMEDVLEALLGLQIVDEADAVTDMRELAQRYRESRHSRLVNLGTVEAPGDEADDGGLRER